VQQHSQSPWRPFVESDCAHIHKIPKGGPFAGRIPEDAGRSKIQCDDINSGVRESVSSRTHERRATTRSPLARDSREKTARMENPGNYHRTERTERTGRRAIIERKVDTNLRQN
jgi:hypothetical protein